MSSVTKLISIYEKVLSARGNIFGQHAVGSNFSATCKEWFGCDYLEFVSDYNDLIDQIKSEIISLDMIKENKKYEYVERLKPAREIFAPEMLVASWDQLFSRLSDSDLRIFLSSIEGFLDHDAKLIFSNFDKNQILESINELDEIISKSKLNSENIKICSMYIDNLRNIIKNELSFKDRKILKNTKRCLVVLWQCMILHLRRRELV